MCVTGLTETDAACDAEILLSLRHRHRHRHRGFFRRGDLLQCAVSNGQLAATHLLLRWGADPGTLDLPEIFAPSRKPLRSLPRNAAALVQLLLQHAGPTLLANQERQGDRLLGRIVFDSDRGMLATPDGQEMARLVRILLQNGASPHLCDNVGTTTLLEGAVFLCGHAHTTDLVLDVLRAGADVSANNFGALRESVRHPNRQTLEVLLLHGGRAFFCPPPPAVRTFLTDPARLGSLLHTAIVAGRPEYIPRLCGLLPSTPKYTFILDKYLSEVGHLLYDRWCSCDRTRFNTEVAHLAYERRIGLSKHICRRPPAWGQGDAPADGDAGISSPHIIAFLLGWYRLGAFTLPGGEARGVFNGKARAILAAVPGLPPLQEMEAWLSRYLAALQEALTAAGPHCGLPVPLVRQVAFYSG